MEEENIQKQKPHTSYNKRLSVAKNPEGEHDNGQGIFFNFILQGGTWQRGGEYGKGYYGNCIILNLLFKLDHKN